VNVSQVQSQTKAGVERVQALADILHSALCCHRNETRALIENPTLHWLQMSNNNVNEDYDRMLLETSEQCIAFVRKDSYS